MATAADKATQAPTVNHTSTVTTAVAQKAATAVYTAFAISATGGPGR
jgi:hypothetical protein